MLKIDLDSLGKQIGNSGKPPVHLWQPELSGDIDIRIKADGSWWHEGRPIERLPLVKLFASILRCEGGEYYLVTPVEKWRLQVEDKPFVAAALITEAPDMLGILSNIEQHIIINKNHPLCLSEPEGDLQRPYIAMPDGLDIRIPRHIYYQLIELAEVKTLADGQQEARVCSAGEEFSLGLF